MNRLFGAQRDAPEQQQQQQSQISQQNEEVKQEQEQVQAEPPKPLDLTEQSEKMETKIQSLGDTISGIEKEIAEQYAKAKNAKGSTQKMYKQKCLMLMKKKKLYEDQQSQYMNQQFTLDQVAFTKQNIQTTLEMGAAMKEAVQQQKVLFEQVNMDELEDIRDDMMDMKMDCDEMNDMLNRNYDCEIDEADLDEEMKALDDELFQEAMQNQSKQTQQNQNQQQNSQQVQQDNLIQNQFM